MPRVITRPGDDTKSSSPRVSFVTEAWRTDNDRQSYDSMIVTSWLFSSFPPWVYQLQDDLKILVALIPWKKAISIVWRQYYDSWELTQPSMNSYTVQDLRKEDQEWLQLTTAESTLNSSGDKQGT